MILPIEGCILHCFCNASKDAYATVIFLRVEQGEIVELRLVAVKSRVAPLKGDGGTIPRKELLAVLVGARLTESVKEALHWKDTRCFYWKDSTKVIAWISREEKWLVFVGNRVQEIRKLSKPSSWQHVHGEMKPIDLPSRGCNAKQLVSLAW
ncbi:uncharacterized protein LOC129987632 [Argiope bruennichi]|uniref:uncharacterized protein LOC129987632 n=1 Tax=Argiope bruennichi TaxID=94029 RepID=UPI002494BEC4|nr:uncharacterized protein LOC129987632 [Argiope bruennichi]